MTPFRYEHVFRAPSVTEVLAAYFDPQHQVEQDAALDIIERTVLEDEDTPTFRRQVCRVVPKRQLPGFVQAILRGPLLYTETVRWRKPDDQIDVEILPSVLGGRARITALYGLEAAGPGQIRRRYEGEVSVEVALVGARIERGIVAEFAKSMPVATTCTQAWLDRNPRSLSARA